MNIFIGSSKEAHEKNILLNISRIVEECGFNPIRWNERPSVFKVGKCTLENLEEIITREKIEASIFIYSSDDKTWYRGENVEKPRDNVIFEHGLFSGKLGRTKSIIVKCGNVSLPTDLLGITHIDYSDGHIVSGEMDLKNWLLELKSTKDKTKISDEKNLDVMLRRSFVNLESAKPYIIEKALTASEIYILANKGLEFFGMDNSIISLADAHKYKNLKRLKIILLSTDSPCVNRGFLALRKYESVDDFKSELNSTHIIIEMGMKKFLKEIPLSKSGIKYHKSEPFFRFIMIDDSIFVSTYAEKPTKQVRDLPVFEINKGYGSLYGSLRKLFNDLWINNSDFGKTLKENIDIEICAGGIVFFKKNDDVYIALVQREDGSWVLPKGHRTNNDNSLEETAIREVSEEAGLSVHKLKCIKKIDSYAHDETAKIYDVNKINHFYLIEYVSDSIKELHADFEHLSARWWNIKEELPYMFYVYQKILISETIKNEFGIDVKINKR